LHVGRALYFIGYSALYIMIKKLFLSICIASCIVYYAESQTNSPFSDLATREWVSNYVAMIIGGDPLAVLTEAGDTLVMEDGVTPIDVE